MKAALVTAVVLGFAGCFVAPGERGPSTATSGTSGSDDRTRGPLWLEGTGAFQSETQIAFLGVDTHQPDPKVLRIEAGDDQLFGCQFIEENHFFDQPAHMLEINFRAQAAIAPGAYAWGRAPDSWTEPGVTFSVEGHEPDGGLARFFGVSGRLDLLSIPPNRTVGSFVARLATTDFADAGVLAGSFDIPACARR